jgi:hypothetical protein
VVLRRQRRTSPGLVAAAVMTVFVGVSVYVRRWCRQKLDELEYVTSSNNNSFDQRNPNDLIVTMERTGLTGITDATSVNAELDGIRKWHTERGYKGGLVIRELTQPLFVVHEESGMIENLEDLALDPWRLARRECYYLYYEITGNGQAANILPRNDASNRCPQLSILLDGIRRRAWLSSASGLSQSSRSNF